MKSKFLRILLSCLLVVTMLISGVACSNGANNNNNTSDNNAGITDNIVGDAGGYENNDGGSEEKNPISEEEGYTFSKTNRVEFYGTHIRNITESTTDFIKSGKTEYILVMPQKTSPLVSEIKADFLLLFKKATGISISVKIDVDVVNDWSVEKKYIVVGDTVLSEKAGIDSSTYSIDVLKLEGYKIVTKGNTQFLLSQNQFGIVNALYEFLTIYFNFDCYHRSGISLDTGVTDLKFKNIDLTEIPDVDYYSGDYNRYGWTLSAEPWDSYALGLETYNKEVAVSNHRMKQHGANNQYLPIYPNFDTKGGYKTIHNVVTAYLPKNSKFEVPETIWQYREQLGFRNEDPKINAHAYMYPDNGGNQICFSGHGNEEILNDMIDICAAKIIFSLMTFKPDRYPQYRFASLTIDDNWDHCSCATCVSDMEKYASSGQVIRFVNQVGDIVQKWLDIQKDENAEYHDCYRDDLTLLIYAYHRDVDPPVNAINNEDGSITYVPKDPSVKFGKNTAIWLVSSGDTAMTGVYDALQGKNLEYHFPGWEAVRGQKSGVYWYNSPVVFCRDYAYDEITQYNNEFWEVLAFYKYKDVFMDHTSGAYEPSGWKTLFNYIGSKLRWDCHTNMEGIIRKYMEGMFYEAADIMYNLYDDMRLYYVNLRANAKDPSRHPLISTADNYPYPVLNGWITSFELAKEKIAHYEETNPDLYITLKTRIGIEEVGEVIKAITFYSGNNSPYNLSKLNEYRTLVSDLAVISPRIEWQSKPIIEYIGG